VLAHIDYHDVAGQHPRAFFTLVRIYDRLTGEPVEFGD